MSETEHEVERFLAGYGSSLADFDAKASAEMWGLPGMILSDEFAGTLDSRELMAHGLEQSYPLYRALGLTGVTHTLLEYVQVTARIVRVRVRWHFYGDAGEHLSDADFEYVLRKDDDGLRAYVATAIDEAERMGELAERKGIDLSRFRAS